MPKSVPQNFIYPLNPKSKFGYTFDKAGKRTTSLENFFKFEIGDYSNLSEWGLKTNFRQIQKGDLIWVHFVLPIGEIRAVGRAATNPYRKDDWDSWAIKIRWDRKKSAALLVRPIQINQRNLSGASTPSARSEKSIRHWLQGKSTVEEKKIAKAVSFRNQMVRQREGQQRFSQSLLRAYNHTCAVTGCQVKEVLEGAHIRSVAGGGNHSVINGIVLRADIHSLFDRGLITVDNHYRIMVSELITDRIYKQLNGKLLKRPESRQNWPSKEFLALHRAAFLLGTG